MGRIRPRRRWWRLPAAALLVLLLLAGVPPLARSASAPPAASGTPAPVVESALREAGSFRLAKVRILGVPVLVVASPALAGAEGPDAAERARVIEGNLDLLYRPRNLCNRGEALGELFLEGGFLHGRERACELRPLALGASADSIRIVVARSGQAPPVLQALLPGREEPLPLLTVTEEDARLNGTTPEHLAARWRSLLERRLRYALRLLTPKEILGRLRLVLLVELVLGLLLFACLWGWRRCRRMALQLERGEPGAGPAGSWGLFRRRGLRQWLATLGRLLLGGSLLLTVAMVGSGLFAIPGQVPLALTVLLQPLGVLLKAALVLLVVLLLRILVRLLLSQWAINPTVPLDQRARRAQRHESLRRVLQRLVVLFGVALMALWVVVDIPGVRGLSANALLASGALLGALALVFQSLLRDFVAGLVILFDDRFAIGDWVEVGNFGGEVVDVGVLSTELRCFDQRVVVLQNGSCEQVVNHTKLRSGAEVQVDLSSRGVDLAAARLLLEEELQAFAADPRWSAELLEPPSLRGITASGAEGVRFSAVALTRSGRQWVVERALRERLLLRLTREGIPLAAPVVSVPLRP